MTLPGFLLEVTTGSFALLAGAGWMLAWRLARSQDTPRHRRPDRQTGPTLSPETRPSDHRPDTSPTGFPAGEEDAMAMTAFIPAMALLLDPMGRMLACNTQARSRYGDSLPALLRHPASRNALHAALHAPLAESNGLPAICTTTISLDVPVRRTVRLAMRRLAGAEKRERSVLVLLADRSAMAATDRMRADFVAHAGHELRTPLASLRGFMELLGNDEETDQPTRRLYLDIMQQQATRMQRLIDRLLLLSRLEMRSHARPRERLEVADLFAIVTGEVMPRFQEDGNRRLEVDCPEGLALLADEDEMVQVLLNLMENAIRYARRPDRPLRVRLAARRAGPEDDHAAMPVTTGPGILLTVSDNGPGIAAHHLPRLTERFYRVRDNVRDNPDRPEDGAEAGTGLGLAIVSQILERHGGRLRFTSTPGEGTHCHLWLPAALPD